MNSITSHNNNNSNVRPRGLARLRWWRGVAQRRGEGGGRLGSCMTYRHDDLTLRRQPHPQPVCSLARLIYIPQR